MFLVYYRLISNRDIEPSLINCKTFNTIINQICKKTTPSLPKNNNNTNNAAYKTPYIYRVY